MNKLYRFENGKRVKALKDKTCPVCKNTFPPRASKDIYCCRECYYKMKKIRGDRVVWTDEMKKRLSKKMSGKNNWNYGNPRNKKGYKIPETSGKNHWNYKRGYTITNFGYKEIIINGKKKLEHRYILEEYLGRKLLSKEIVHHINGDKTDNDIKNLMICTRAEHINIHRDDLKTTN